jgi:hypothetical protein
MRTYFPSAVHLRQPASSRDSSTARHVGVSADSNRDTCGNVRLRPGKSRYSCRSWRSGSRVGTADLSPTSAKANREPHLAFATQQNRRQVATVFATMRGTGLRYERPVPERNASAKRGDERGSPPHAEAVLLHLASRCKSGGMACCCAPRRETANWTGNTCGFYVIQPITFWDRAIMTTGAGHKSESGDPACEHDNDR